MQIDDPLTKRVHIKMSRLPQRVHPAPHRQHRLLRSLDQGRRARDPRLHRPPGRQLRGRRGRLRPPAQGAAAGEARSRRGRALAAPLRGGAQRGRGVQRLRRARRHRPVRGAGLGPEAAGRVQRREPDPLHRLEPLGALQGRARRGRVRGLSMEPGAATLTGSVPTAELELPRLRTRGGRRRARGRDAPRRRCAGRWSTFHPRLYIACSFQKTSSVTVHMATRINPEARFFYLDTDVLFPETYETKDRLEERYGISFHRYSSITARAAGGPLRRPALVPRPGRLLRDPQGRADALRAVGGRLLGLRHPPPGLADAGLCAQVRLGQALRPLEAEPARRLDREGRLELHRRARHPLQPAARPGLPLDRLHPLHPQAGRGRGPAGRPLGRDRRRPSAAFTARPDPV